MNIVLKMNSILCATLLTGNVAALAQEVSVARFRGDRRCAVSLTFDDGAQEDYTLIAPHLEQYGLRGTFTINGKMIGDLDDHYTPRLTWKEVAELHRRGHEISNHSWSHPHMTKLTDEELRQEVERNDSAIMAATGQRPLSFIYPYNQWDDRVKEACMQGRVGMREYQIGLGQANSFQTRESIAAWLRQQIDEGLWGIGMTHGIYTAWDRWEEPWIFWDLMRELGLKSDTIWNATFAEVAAYVAERDAVKLDVAQRKGVTTITPHLDLDPQVFTQPLTMKVTGSFDKKVARYAKLGAWRAVQDGKNLPITRRGDDLLFEFNPFGGAITLEPLKEDPLAGKKICFLGDSYVANHRQPKENTWHSKVAARHGMTYCNYGRNGGAIAFDRTNRNFGKALYVRYAEMDDDADYVVVIAGHNDAYFVMQDADSLAAFVEHLDDLCVGLKQKYPHAKLAFVSPWNVAYEGFTVVMYHIQEACSRHNIPFLNAAATSGIEVENPAFRERFCQHKGDRAHLNPEGHDLLIEWGETFLMSL